MTEPVVCACPPVRHLAELGLAQEPIPPCDVHRRPDPSQVTADPMPLNGDPILQSVRQKLRIPETEETQQ